MTTARTMTDREINESARFYPHHEARDASDITSYPFIEIGGDADGDGAVQVYVYAQDGVLHVSLDYDTAGPDRDRGGPWAYYGPDRQIPTVVTGGNGEPVYEELPDPDLRQEPPIWNVVVRVLARQAAANGPAALSAVSGNLIRAGFDLVDGPGYSAWQDAGDHDWHVTLTVVACRRAPYGAAARSELALALNRAGFRVQAPKPGDFFQAEEGTEVTPLPGEVTA
jgi:hypothetical protein